MNQAAHSPVRPPVLGAIEVVLSVKNIPVMDEFYTEVLGFQRHSAASMETETVDPTGDPTIVFLTIANIDSPLGRNRHPQMLVLIDYQRHVFAKGRLTGHDVSRSTLNHLAFEIRREAYAEHKTHLESHGIQPTETIFENMQARALFFKDPEGNTLELICHDPDIGS